MIREFFRRATVGFASSTLVGQLISIFIALRSGRSASFPSPVTERFALLVGNPVAGAFLQLLLAGLLGFVFAGCTVLFQVERWSFLRQSACYVAATGAVCLGVEWLCWAPESPAAALAFAGGMLLTYAITLGVQYLVWRARVRRLNEQIQRRNAHERD